MEYRLLGRTGLRVSELCLGTMTFGREADENESARMLETFVDAGGNFLDTANIYSLGRSEEIVGRLLRGTRDKFVVATKARFPMGEGPNDAGSSRVHIMRAIDDSLRRLQTDYIDLYQLHCWDPITPLFETMSTLNDLVRAGKVRHIGCSNFMGWQIVKAHAISEKNGWEKFVSLQPQYSLIVRDIEREIIPACLEEGLGVIPWSPLGGGFLSGKYRRGESLKGDTRHSRALPEQEDAWNKRATERNFDIVDVVVSIAQERGKAPSQVALAWLMAQPGVVAPITGARNVAQLKDNLGASGWQLSPEEIQRLHEISRPDDEYPKRFIQWAAGRR